MYVNMRRKHTYVLATCGARVCIMVLRYYRVASSILYIIYHFKYIVYGQGTLGTLKAL